MINKNKFYSKNDLPGRGSKNIMWDEIQNSFPVKRKISRTYSLDIKSFSFGIAFTTVVFIIAIGAVRFVPGMFYDFKNDDTKINKAYSSAAEELEKSIPNFVSTLDKSERTKELLNVRLEELKFINDAIRQYNMTLIQSDLTKIKQERLLELYQLKIDAINKIIKLKGDAWL